MHFFLFLAPKLGFCVENNGKLVSSSFTSMAGCVGYLGAGLAHSKANKEYNDIDFDDDDSDGGSRPGAIGQNTVSLTCHPFVEVALIFVSYLGVSIVLITKPSDQMQQKGHAYSICTLYLSSKRLAPSYLISIYTIHILDPHILEN